MTIAAVKEKLHEYIDHADNKKVKAIFTLLENDFALYKQSENEVALEESINRALEQSKKGLSRPHKEVMGKIRKRYKV